MTGALSQTGFDKHDPNIRQALASNPADSVWVSASAGTGKTKILTDRVLRLLLPRPKQDISSASAPDKILCLTYTKTAASEMAERIHKRLSEWAVMPEDKLAENLEDLLRTTPDETLLNAARALFAKVVDTPGGMKIMTIHSFCQSVLKRFPLEAGLPAHFEVLDDWTTQDYMQRAQRQLIARIQAAPDSLRAEGFTALTREVNSDQFQTLMADLTKHRGRLARMASRYPDADSLRHAIYSALGCDPKDTPESILADFCGSARLDETALRNAVRFLAEGSQTDQKNADGLQHFIDAALEDRMTGFEDYRSVFLTQKNTIKASLATKAVKTACPDIVDIMNNEAVRVQDFVHKMQSLGVAIQSFDLLFVGAELVKLYENIKSMNLQLDYDDLIHYTRRLLTESGQAGWVLYKMDQGIDHILLDEAQDTSPDQWEVIRALSDEFFGGESARDDVLRTLFVVGDEKQSIFSFQGADPAGFQTRRIYFSERIRAAEHNFTPVNLLMSFRSAPAVLTTVDHIFSSARIASGVHTDSSQPLHHQPFRKGQAGLIEIWPLITADTAAPAAAWTPAVKVTTSENAKIRLANKIAETVAGWLDRGEMLESQNRPIRPGDILILFRSRPGLLDYTVRALKQYNIPVSGVDRIVLTDHLAVQDCLAMAEFALLPEDDLTLASILKSPFIGYEEEALYQLAYGRRGSLWAALEDFDPKLYDWLSKIIQNVQTHTPYDFLQDLLVRPCPGDTVSGRRALYTRLGLEINDALDELLNICLDFQSLHSPNLQKFLFWFRQGQAEVKREQESSSGNQVRLMTVHASKGLQAPIVFLPDTVKSMINKPGVLWPETEDELPFWTPRKDQGDPHCQARLDAQKIKQEEESRRLLYVALTRAEDRLYICGAQDKGRLPEGCWYQLCQMMLRDMNDVQTIPFLMGDLPVTDIDSGQPSPALSYISPQTAPYKDKSEDSTDTQRTPLPDLPAYLSTPPPPEPSPPRPLAPSRPSDPEPAIRSPLQADDSYRFSRGNLVHQLLEILPQLPESRRETACRTYLAKPAHQLTTAQQTALCAEIIKVLHHPDFAPIFGADSRAEVPITGLLDKQAQSDYYAISGQIDRMLVEAQRILIVDYKTNRPPPRDESGVPDIYWRQMAAYQSALAHIYPGRRIECALLWTDGPHLMPLSEDRLAKFKKA